MMRPMHLPDGFLTANTWIPAWIVSLGGIGFSFRKVSKSFKEKTIPMMGVTSAFIFAAQMINFPVIGGTSGHLLGGVLAAVLLGPFAGAIILTIVLTAQCFLFQDGGVTTLGANILNMAIVGTMGGYYVYSAIRKLLGGDKGILIGVIVASWLSVIFAASACAIELALSKTSPLSITFPAMAGIHALIGIGEAIITFLIIKFILKVRPDFIFIEGDFKMRKKDILIVLLIAIAIGVVLSPFASKLPDGLESVAIKLGFIDKIKK